MRRHIAGMLPVLTLGFAVAGAAAQGILSSGNTALPTCAQSCQLLNQAEQACSGTASASQEAWICFCQSAYLKTLYTSPDGICTAYCTNPSDNEQVMTWYKSNCGTDNGASEHPNKGSTGATTTSAGSGATATSSTGSTTGNSSGSSGSSAGETWWATHYRWIIMLIVVALGLGAIAGIGVWLKRRYHRQQDQIRGGFNAGITQNAPPMTSASRVDASGVFTPGVEAGPSGSSSPARTRDAFMPYGYGYSRSETRLSRQTIPDDRRSPLARGETPLGDVEKDAGQPVSADHQRQPKRALVHERSVDDDAQN